MKEWKRLEILESHDFGFFRVDEDRVMSPGGQEVSYSSVRMSSPFVVIIPVDTLGRVWLVKQHRYPLDRFMIEFPGGVVDPDEDVFQAAKRELEEEVGLRSDDWRPLGRIHEAGVTLEAPGFVFFAFEVEEIPNPKRDLMDKDLFEIIQYEISTFQEMIKKAIITDSATISAFCKARLNGYI